MSIDVRVRGGGDLARLARQVRDAGGPQLRRQLTSGVRAEVQLLVPAVRQAALAIPAKGPKHSGLRQRLARAVTVNVRTTGRHAGVSISVDPKKMPWGEKALPALMEGEAVVRGRRADTRWRHPVYGRDVWVQQEPHPFFYKTVRPLAVKTRRGINDALGRVTRNIT
ncbi:hypothetical protein [Streptomyces sp. 891-h]|uniref:hypothetical protein n=1 Tax=Streptomyces sp. 891-h TaxID=2720714 RepID=UPI001FAAA746|nr:hypothetical protein [Streptomyces sp. 891-h]UNZ20628.1 hypothetical protein HC362_29750 [Streptomyces sp. 891-h]